MHEEQLGIDQSWVPDRCVDTELQLLWPPDFEQVYSGTFLKGYL